MDGFYEWQQHGVPKGGKKQPFRIRRRDGQPFAFAGLWESWKGPKGGPALEHPLETATIVTTDANGVLKPLHDRMPVILAPEDYDAWLDPETPKEAAEALLRPCPEDWLEAYPVSTRVNSVRNEDASLVEPLEEEPAAAAEQPGSPGCCRGGYGGGHVYTPLPGRKCNHLDASGGKA